MRQGKIGSNSIRKVLVKNWDRKEARGKLNCKTKWGTDLGLPVSLNGGKKYIS